MFKEKRPRTCVTKENESKIVLQYEASSPGGYSVKTNILRSTLVYVNLPPKKPDPDSSPPKKPRQVDMAINHYIEARANAKAVGACLTSRQWSKAAQLVETLDGDSARPHLRTLARHHEEAGNYALAERFFVDADAPQLAVEMYTKARHDCVHGAREGGSRAG